MRTKAGEQSQVLEPTDFPTKQFVWAAIKLNVVIGGFLVVQWLLLGIETEVVILPEVFALSFLMSWRFVRPGSPSLSLWQGMLLGVVANVLRTGFIYVFVPGGIVRFGTLPFILPGVLILLGCIAGGFFASRPRPAEAGRGRY